MAITGTKWILRCLVLAAAIFPHLNATANSTTNSVFLGSAYRFTVRPKIQIPLPIAFNLTGITGELAMFPNPPITGPGHVVLHAVNQSADTGGMLTATSDFVTAFNAAAGRAATTTHTPIYDLSGQMLMPGVYHDSSSFGITGTRTLGALHNPNAVWVFEAGSSLTTASSSEAVLSNGAQAGTTATLGIDSGFVGNILASASVTADTGATEDGRLFAGTGSVTLDNNPIAESFLNNGSPAGSGGAGGTAAPDTGSTLLLLGGGLAALFAFGRRFTSLA
jgi:hypothetical protein